MEREDYPENFEQFITRFATDQDCNDLYIESALASRICLPLLSMRSILADSNRQYCKIFQKCLISITLRTEADFSKIINAKISWGGGKIKMNFSPYRKNTEIMTIPAIQASSVRPQYPALCRPSSCPYQKSDPRSCQNTKTVSATV